MKAFGYGASMLTVALLASAPACTATYGAGYQYGRNGANSNDERGDYRQVERLAYNNGLHEGQEAGEHDGKSGRRYDPDRHSDWRDADEGYRRSYGDKDLYRRSFRSGFEAGYSQAFSRYSAYDRR
jgi:hypothetical protein